ncbi:hypothetical protein DCAR_0726901 [Daucus carota subsp. sativus]|uniref:Uncharacterized protein n=1 Tax=Daucus carota subsp. sativus TaxID=79200 RepID=A0A161X1X1_DAUCS|nr:hypothetical protein DCAR_0726901 [Daucus carota subsp. sativus]
MLDPTCCLRSKFQIFLRRVLNDDPDVEISHWGDLNYYTSMVAGNPTLMLINQLREDNRKGKLDPHNTLRPPRRENSTRTHVRAPNGSNSACPPTVATINSTWKIMFAMVEGNQDATADDNAIDDVDAFKIFERLGTCFGLPVMPKVGRKVRCSMKANTGSQKGSTKADMGASLMAAAIYVEP